MQTALQPPSPKDFSTSKVILFLLLAGAAITILHSCRIQQRIEEAKIQAVKMDRLENPCVNDSIKILIPGEALTLIDSVHHYHTDTVVGKNHTDTLIITKRTRIVDTFKTTVKDLSLAKSWMDSANTQKRINARLQGNNDQLVQTLDSTDKKLTKRTWMLLGIIFSLIAYVGVRLYLSFKIPIR